MDFLYDQIENNEDTNLIRRMLSGGYTNNEYVKNVAKYFLVNLFILVFADMEIYRAAKYILFLDNKEVKSNLKRKFFYEWAIELGKILRVYDIPTFIKQYAKLVVELLEEGINRSDGVIGKKNNFGSVVQNMIPIFEDFISRSKYSKISSKFPTCPSPVSCENSSDPSCEIYSHGQKTSSRYDFT